MSLSSRIYIFVFWYLSTYISNEIHIHRFSFPFPGKLRMFIFDYGTMLSSSSRIFIVRRNHYCYRWTLMSLHLDNSTFGDLIACGLCPTSFLPIHIETLFDFLLSSCSNSAVNLICVNSIWPHLLLIIPRTLGLPSSIRDPFAYDGNPRTNKSHVAFTVVSLIWNGLELEIPHYYSCISLIINGVANMRYARKMRSVLN